MDGEREAEKVCSCKDRLSSMEQRLKDQQEEHCKHLKHLVENMIHIGKLAQYVKASGLEWESGSSLVIAPVQTDIRNVISVIFRGSLKERQKQQNYVGYLFMSFVRSNIDAFAWQNSDMIGVDLEVAIHHLSIKLSSRPVRQKIRRFHPQQQQQQIIREKVTRLLEIVYATTGHKLLSFMDTYSRYNQIPMYSPDSEKTTFIIGDDIYYFNVIPFSLKNTRATYQCMLQAILNMSFPTTKKQIQALTRRLVALNKFISRSSNKLRPFFITLKQCRDFNWNEECEQAFSVIKIYFSSPPILN
uniref:Reverse transcriptase/retrotransposon-derived protein RNase H-like domain-containing protein n=1 Tax=Vitis vinifera TaxID=29760 RepID=A5B1U3_VITVI|nr:hypothetical protein VITISV_010020 [Vitis vinifera]